MNPTPKELYTTRIAAHTTRLKQLKRRSMRVAVARLAAFAGLLLALYLYFTGGQLLMLALTLAGHWLIQRFGKPPHSNPQVA